MTETIEVTKEDAETVRTILAHLATGGQLALDEESQDRVQEISTSLREAGA